LPGEFDTGPVAFESREVRRAHERNAGRTTRACARFDSGETLRDAGGIRRSVRALLFSVHAGFITTRISTDHVPDSVITAYLRAARIAPNVDQPIGPEGEMLR